jgi:prolipoprotein diacylglyceryltransferase
MMNILCVHHRDGLFCVLVIFIFKKQLKLSAWGANIRMAIATVVVFWVPVEVLGRLDFFHEFWVEPEKYVTQMLSILVAFLVLLVYIMMAVRKKSTHAESQ